MAKKTKGMIKDGPATVGENIVNRGPERDAAAREVAARMKPVSGPTIFRGAGTLCLPGCNRPVKFNRETGLARVIEQKAIDRLREKGYEEVSAVSE